MTNEQYWNLDKHFTEPKTKYVHKKLPRKLKKKMHNLINSLGCPLSVTVKTYDLDVMMWYMGWHANPNYRTFLIKKIVDNNTYK